MKRIDTIKVISEDNILNLEEEADRAVIKARELNLICNGAQIKIVKAPKNNFDNRAYIATLTFEFVGEETFKPKQSVSFVTGTDNKDLNLEIQFIIDKERKANRFCKSVDVDATNTPELDFGFFAAVILTEEEAPTYDPDRDGWLF